MVTAFLLSCGRSIPSVGSFGVKLRKYWFAIVEGLWPAVTDERPVSGHRKFSHQKKLASLSMKLLHQQKCSAELAVPVNNKVVFVLVSSPSFISSVVRAFQRERDIQIIFILFR